SRNRAHRADRLFAGWRDRDQLCTGLPCGGGYADRRELPAARPTPERGVGCSVWRDLVGWARAGRGGGPRALASAPAVRLDFGAARAGGAPDRDGVGLFRLGMAQQRSADPP